MGHRLAFLVIEDDKVLLRQILRLLRPYGEAEGVESCAAARRALRGRRFDAVLVDVHLPDGSGLDLLPVARTVNPAVTLLVMTVLAEHRIIAAAHAHGARYLLKPVDALHLEILADEARSKVGARRRRMRRALARWIDDYALSEAESDLLELGARGVAREEFAGRRGVRPDTIRKQVQFLLRKTGDDTFEAAVNRLLREALADPI